MAEMTTAKPPLPDGLVAIVKEDCPTCVLVAPVLADLADRASMTTITQDNAAFPQVADWVVHDHDLAYSWFHEIDTVPTLLRVVGVKLVAEPGGAVSLAAALSNKKALQGQTVVALVSGGNVDMDSFLGWMV